MNGERLLLGSLILFYGVKLYGWAKDTFRESRRLEKYKANKMRKVWEERLVHGKEREG